MSRLDIFTVAIVAICVLAIVFLLYRTTDLFNSDNPVPPETIDLPEDPVEEQDTTVIDPADYDPEYQEGSAASDSAYTETGESVEQEGETQAAKEEKGETEEEGESEFSELYKAGGGVGDYLVLAGSFEYRHNADNQAKRLRELGYTDVEVVIFNRGKYATVLVDRFDGLSDANALVTRLDGQNVEAYVHEKRVGSN
ncbi:MAG: SPOR domain-containing protein [Bacteroidetes bacterium]|nr:SPOR domain-containing protein [Bacteroidota bacterium]